MAKRSWQTTVMEMLIPLLFLFAFNAPGLSNPKPIVPPLAVQQPNGSTALGLMSTVLESPVFPNTGPFSAQYIPSNWSSAQGSAPGLMYYPNTSTQVQSIMNTIKTNILSNAVAPVPLYGFATEKDMVQYYEAHPMTVWAGISFYKDGTNPNSRTTTTTTGDFSYAIRINGSYVPSTDANQQQVHVGHLGGASSVDASKYHAVGFLLLQWAVDQAIIQNIVGAAVPTFQYQPPAVPKDLQSYQCFAHAKSPQATSRCNLTANIGFRPLPTINDPTVELLWIFKWLPGWCLNVASVFFFSAQLVPLINERKHRLPLSLMGLRDSAMLLASLLSSACVAVPLSLCYTGIWSLVNILYFSNPLLIAVFFFLYLISMASFAVTIAPLLTNADRSVQTIFLFCFAWGLAYVAALLTTPTGGSSSSSSNSGGGEGNSAFKLLLAVVPFGAAHLGGELVVAFEGQNVGITWATVLQRDGGNPSFAQLLVVMALSIVVWSVVGAYLDVVLKDPEHGERRHVCFCVEDVCCHRRQCRTPNTTSPSQSSQSSQSSQLHSPLLVGEGDYRSGRSDVHHEPLNELQMNSTVASVRNLKKIYQVACQKSKVAVDGLNFTLQRNQIFCLLGHNGAGKTSTIKAMTNGAFDGGDIKYTFHTGSNGTNHTGPPTTATFDMSMSNDRSAVRSFIGLCPQHDVLWSECTPIEHLQFFARLKGIPSSEIAQQVNALIQQIRLPVGDEHRPVGTFSGGNRRKVSLAMALVGKPQIVFLDE